MSLLLISHIDIQGYFIYLLITGADMDVCLSQYGYCNFISPKHAMVFYDEVSIQKRKIICSNQVLLVIYLENL